MALERVKPIPRPTAQVNLSHMVTDAGLKNTIDVVDYFIRRFMRVPPAGEKRQALIAFLNKEWSTPDVAVAKTYMEDSLRLALHLLLSEPEYQLG
jgi:hypothetical protein